MYPIFGEFEVAIFAVAFFYIGFDFFFAFMDGFQMSTEFCHLTGALFGGAIATWMLKSRRVDCEGYDIFAMVTGKLGEKPKPTLEQEKQAQELAEQRRTEFKAGREKLDHYLSAGHLEMAMNKLRQLKKLNPKFELTSTQSWHLIQGSIQKEKFKPAVDLIENHIDRFPETKVPMILNLAKVYLKHLQRPRKAISTINRLEGLPLSTKQKQVAIKVRQRAFDAINNGMLEVQTDDD